ncbi:insulinase family protein [Cyanobacterium stanieri LEGE 03274]|uniref:Insulinase family protein n=1 Tax=Cyanobacterium stanieri LEGE 03274 TaxID=1828756 RepID=A0ABR9V2Z5_9CHRO|nr:pitrilysin family protein [Cyanobacterium stanieri]MBE9222266.1 insulinase family protein [Cyanobacterium stanieri LEGE 03274]
MSLTAVKPTLNSLPTITTLSNGLTIIAEQMPVDAVNFNVWFNVGSAVESNQINGMAHFLEHMIFKGSQKLVCGEFEQIVEARGAVTNAATSQEYTHFYVTSSPQDFAHLAPLQLDLVLNSSLPESEFIREKLVVLEEIRRAKDNPRRLAFEKAMKICFPSLPYSRPILGTEEIIEPLTRQQMYDFHRYWYQPPSMTVNAVGNLPVEDLTAIVADVMGDLRREGQQTFKPQIMAELPFNVIVREDYTDSALQQSRMIMMWRVPGLISFHDTLALDVLAMILGQGKLSRLFRSLREEQRLVKGIGASNMNHQVQGVFYIASQLDKGNLGKVEQEVINHIKDIQDNGVSEAELNRVCNLVANQFIFHSEKPSDRANLYGYYYSQLGSLDLAFSYTDNLRSLTVDDIQQAARKYLHVDAYGVVRAMND